jgi:hypothetical protein
VSDSRSTAPERVPPPHRSWRDLPPAPPYGTPLPPPPPVAPATLPGAAPAPSRSRRPWLVASAIGAAAALSIGVFAATRDDGHTAVPVTTTTTPTTAPGRSSTRVTPDQPSAGRIPNRSGAGTNPSSGGGGDQGSSQLPENGNGSIQLPDGSQLPDLGTLPGFNGQSIDEIIRDILRRLGIDPDTVLPSGPQGGSSNGWGGAGS